MIARKQEESHLHHLLFDGENFSSGVAKAIPFFLQNCAWWTRELSGKGFAAP